MLRLSSAVVKVTGLQRAALGSSWLYWAVLGRAKRNWVVVGCIGLHWVFLGCEFLAVQDSSIGDIDSQSLSQTDF